MSDPTGPTIPTMPSPLYGPVRVYKIKTYEVRWQGKFARPWIMLWLDGADHVDVFFEDDGTELPDPKSYGGRPPTHFSVYYYRSQYQGIVDLLRNERPVYFVWHSPAINMITTGKEAAGEEEKIAESITESIVNERVSNLVSAGISREDISRIMGNIGELMSKGLVREDIQKIIKKVKKDIDFRNEFIRDPRKTVNERL